MTPATLEPGFEIDLVIEKPAAGGRMLARHDGQVVFVLGAIPGERVRARIEQVKSGLAFASTLAVLDASPDRRAPACDLACGGSVLAHVTPGRQRQLKLEIVRDAFARIAKLPLPDALAIHASPEHGYRMRARLHVRRGRLGFFREGSHDLCDAGPTGQLLPESLSVLEEVTAACRARGVAALREIELSENVPANERALLVEVAPGTGDGEIAAIGRAVTRPGVTGALVTRPDGPRLAGRGGVPYVTDTLDLAVDGRRARVTLRRHVSAFFQGNRFLLQDLVRTVISLVPEGRLVELYAGAGLFGLSFAALGRGQVTLVEGDRTGADDLKANAKALGRQVNGTPVPASAAADLSPAPSPVLVRAQPVESWLAAHPSAGGATLLIDPPRTGMSRPACEAIAASGAPRIVYVSCDVATLARDARRLTETGYGLTHVECFDLFPNTAHVETVALFQKSRDGG